MAEHVAPEPASDSSRGALGSVVIAGSAAFFPAGSYFGIRNCPHGGYNLANAHAILLAFAAVLFGHHWLCRRWPRYRARGRARSGSRWRAQCLWLEIGLRFGFRAPAVAHR